MREPSEAARLFHETYERLAPEFGYETRQASRVPWESLPEPNRKLMQAVCAEVVPVLATEAVAKAVGPYQVILADAVQNEECINGNDDGCWHCEAREILGGNGGPARIREAFVEYATEAVAKEREACEQVVERELHARGIVTRVVTAVCAAIRARGREEGSDGP